MKKTMTRKLTKAQVAERYGGVSVNTISRWAANPEMGFPQAVYFASRPMWDLLELEVWDAKQAERQRRGEQAGAERAE